jgi:hypothetical protein
MKQKPGPGWKYVGSAVWDHKSGLRLHIMGLCRLPNGEEVNGFRWPESRELDRWIRIAGGNRRRGAMLWALSKLGPNDLF